MVSHTQEAVTQRKGWVPAIASGLVVLLASVGIYSILQIQAAQKLMAVEAQMGGGPNPMEMVAKLRGAPQRKSPMIYRAKLWQGALIRH